MQSEGSLRLDKNSPLNRILSHLNRARDFRASKWSVPFVHMYNVARMGDQRKVYYILVGKPEGKKPLGKPRHRLEDSIRMDLTQIC
jgi:hypothetical protein